MFRKHALAISQHDEILEEEEKRKETTEFGKRLANQVVAENRSTTYERLALMVWYMLYGILWYKECDCEYTHVQRTLLYVVLIVGVARGKRQRSFRYTYSVHIGGIEITQYNERACMILYCVWYNVVLD